MSLFRKGMKATSVETVTNLTYGGSGYGSKFGVPIGQDSALSITSVYACVRLISETVAALPVHVYRREGTTRSQVETPQWLIKPNPEITTFELFERTIASLNLDGNAFWYFEHDMLGRIAEVWPLHPSAVQVLRNQKTREIEYKVGTETFDSMNILHIRAFAGSGGLRGLSPIGLFRTGALALTAALEESGSRYFENGSVLSGVIETPQDMTTASLERMAERWKADHTGLQNAHLPGFLTGGASFKPITIPNDQAQFLESRHFQVEEICRIFRVQPHKIAELNHATFSNIEHQKIEFATDTIQPWLSRIESACAPLLGGDSYLKFDMNGLLRGDTLSRFSAYNMGIQGGWLCADEPRAWEDLDPITDGAGAVFRAPLNMAPISGEDGPSAREIAEMIQKVYLGVGVVVSAEEARALLTRAGADLPGSLPARDGASV